MVQFIVRHGGCFIDDQIDRVVGALEAVRDGDGVAQREAVVDVCDSGLAQGQHAGEEGVAGDGGGGVVCDAEEAVGGAGVVDCVGGWWWLGEG